MLNSITSSFLWGGTSLNRKISKVSLNTCMLPKHLGRLGLLDIRLMSIKLAAKWITRAMDSKDYWSMLITKNFHKF